MFHLTELIFGHVYFVLIYYVQHCIALLSFCIPKTGISTVGDTGMHNVKPVYIIEGLGVQTKYVA